MKSKSSKVQDSSRWQHYGFELLTRVELLLAQPSFLVESNALYFFNFVFGLEISNSFSKASGDIKSDVAIFCRNASLAHGSLT
jgi:hypothetical protein